MSVSRGGHKPGEQYYIPVEYNGKRYVVGFVNSIAGTTSFVFDANIYEEVSGRIWHRCSENYVSSSIMVDGKKKELFLHNLVMGKLSFDGKGQSETVEHINRIGFDNRCENLRLSTQTEQNLSQKTKSRSATLPEGCGISSDEIPRHIWYIRANGSHGDRFAIEMKTENILWKSTASKKISLKEKLEEAKTKLTELYDLYPYLNPDNPEKKKVIEDLTRSYNEIIVIAESKI